MNRNYADGMETTVTIVPAYNKALRTMQFGFAELGGVLPQVKLQAEPSATVEHNRQQARSKNARDTLSALLEQMRRGERPGKFPAYRKIRRAEGSRSHLPIVPSALTDVFALQKLQAEPSQTVQRNRQQATAIIHIF